MCLTREINIHEIETDQTDKIACTVRVDYIIITLV